MQGEAEVQKGKKARNYKKLNEQCLKDCKAVEDACDAACSGDSQVTAQGADSFSSPKDRCFNACSNEAYSCRQSC